MLHLFLLCFIVLVSSVQNVPQNCSFGILKYGTAVWGINIHGKSINGSLSIADDGLSSIETIGKIWDKFSPYIVCIAPFDKNGNIITNNDDCDYGLLNGGVIAWGTNVKNIRITQTRSVLGGRNSINVFTDIMNDGIEVRRIMFQPLEV